MTLHILATTDLHGAIFPTDFTSPTQLNQFGLARISTFLKQEREKHDVLYIDNGDSYQGTPLCTFAHQHLNKYMNPMAQAMNAMDCQYFNLGNHDFNYGQDVLFEYIKNHKGTLLTSNILFDGKPLGSTQIFNHGGKNVALIGVTTHYIPNWEQPNNIQGFIFKDALETMIAEVAHVKDTVDYVIGVYHGGLELDPNTSKPTEIYTSENQGSKMCDIEGLDLLITGHQHRSLVEFINGVTVTQNTLKGEEFITVDIDLESRDIQAKLHQSKDYAVDHDLLNPLMDLYNATQTWLDQDIGQLADRDLIVTDMFQARAKKHPLVSFLNQVQLDATGADISAISLFNGVAGFNKNITMRDLVSTYIFPNTLVVKNISGKKLREMLEFSAYFFDIDSSGNLMVSTEYETPKPQHYNYDMLDGIDYTIDVRCSRGNRITKLQRNGIDIVDTDTFSIVMNNYRAMGGGDYHMIPTCPTIKEYPDEMVDIIMKYFSELSPVKVRHYDNIEVLY